VPLLCPWHSGDSLKSPFHYRLEGIDSITPRSAESKVAQCLVDVSTGEPDNAASHVRFADCSRVKPVEAAMRLLGIQENEWPLRTTHLGLFSRDHSEAGLGFGRFCGSTTGKSFESSPGNQVEEPVACWAFSKYPKLRRSRFLARKIIVLTSGRRRLSALAISA
jgi:hypothetical protein